MSKRNEKERAKLEKKKKIYEAPDETPTLREPVKEGKPDLDELRAKFLKRSKK